MNDEHRTQAGRFVTLEPQHPVQRVPLAPHALHDRRTRVEDTHVLCHLGVPRLSPEERALEIDGQCARPLALRYTDLLRYAKLELSSDHQCCDSPFAPFEPTRRVCNVSWGGARLADVLDDARPSSSARYVWSQGADRGEFGGVRVDAYRKDLPLERVAQDVLIAYEMNGQLLTAEHGAPARLVVPGFYGTNAVKWLVRLTLSDARASGPFTTRWYSDPVLDAHGEETGQSTPVWSIAPESVIVSPAPRETVPMGREREVWGWAWADGGVSQVLIRASDTESWVPACLEPARGHEWQRFSFSWTPFHRGPLLLASRAVSRGGERQPFAGRRNATYGVSLMVA